MNDDVVLRVTGLSKRFKIYDSPWGRLREWLVLGKSVHHRPFCAVKDVSFEVRRGEFLGIVGVNGAGKSTLLKIITGVLQANEGTCHVNGRVLSLLELSGGFDKYLTGKENVVRTAEALGFSSGYAQERMEEIIEFSELGEFFDRQVRFYSSGMGARLAFALYAFLESEVLILDEVLAVGDIFFRQKCYARLEELIAKGTTIILVSHNIGMIRYYCDRVLVLHRGEKVYHGEADRGIRFFMNVQRSRAPLSARDTFSDDDSDLDMDLALSSRNGSGMSWPSDECFALTAMPKLDAGGKARLTQFAICNEKGESWQAFKQGEVAYLHCEYQLNEDIGIPVAGIEITNEFNLLVHSKNSLQGGAEAPRRVHRGDYVRFSQSITLGLAPGNYVFALTLSAIHPDDYARLGESAEGEPHEKMAHLCRVEQAAVLVVIPRYGERLKQLHGGLCDLSGSCQMQLVSVDPESTSLLADFQGQKRTRK